MLDRYNNAQLYKIDSFSGITIYNLKTEKFKTNTINIFFHDNLTRENASRNALLPAVLRRGCSRFPTFRDISLYLEELYGATFDCGVTKKGEMQIIQFYIDYVSDRYTGENSRLFEKAFDLLFEIITSPVLENGVFKNDYVEQEKDNLRKLIESRVNDKMQYSVEKCLEEMCKDEPFGIYDYGSVEELKKIDAKGLYDYYVTFLQTLPISVYITGNVEESMIDNVIKKLSNIKRGNIKETNTGEVVKEVAEVRNITETMPVNQSKLSLGFRTNISSSDEDYYALVVYNGILGGSIHSKLFQNVRRKKAWPIMLFHGWKSLKVSWS